MFDRLMVIFVSFGLAIICVSPSANVEGRSVLEINHYRLKQSTLISPKSLMENRYKFVLGKESIKSSSNALKQHDSSKARCSDQKLLKGVMDKTAVKLDWTMMHPVRLPIAQKFGEGALKLSRGVVYNVNTFQSVYAPLSGKVIFAGSMKDFGGVVMIERDLENIVLIAGVSKLNITKGSIVGRGQKIGDVVKGNRVYLEFRNTGNPVDPQQVLVSG